MTTGTKTEGAQEKWNYFVGNANGRGLIRIEVEGTGEHIASMPRGVKSETRAELITRAPELLVQRDELLAALKGLVRYAEAVRYTAGMGPNQLARLESAKAAIERAEGAQG